MASAVIGKVLPTFTGQYDQQKKYTFLDVVLYGGSSYVCKTDNTGKLPDSSDAWVMIASAGDSSRDQISYDADKHILTINDQEVSLATEQKIDTDNADKSKKPSDYPEGFSYELKGVGAVELDRSNYDKSVQDGTQGLLTTVVVSGFVRQRLEIIDSSRPLTFERNGMQDTWNGWEFVTNLVAAKEDTGTSDAPASSASTSDAPSSSNVSTSAAPASEVDSA